MKTTYVTLEQAKQLKKLKINCTPLIEEGCAKAYGKKGEDVNWTTKHFHVWKPSLDYACKFLREDYDIHISPYPSYNAYGVIYMCSIICIHKNKVYNNLLKEEPLTIDYAPPQIFDTYEQAQSAGLDFAFKFITKHKVKFMTEKDKEARRRKVEKVKKMNQRVLDKSLEATKKFFKKQKTK